MTPPRRNDAPPAALLDTNVFIALLRDKAHGALIRRASGPGRIVLPTLALAEVASLEARGSVARGTTRKASKRAVTYELTKAIAEAAGVAHGHARRFPHSRLSLVDTLLAALARSLGSTLLTTDPELSRLPGTTRIRIPDA